jgi:hypothetical protein
MLIIIPTRHDGPNAFMLASAEAHLGRFGLKTVIIAIGSSATRAWHASEAALVIPLPIAKVLIEDACAGFPDALSRVFGFGIPYLGFGGSSNLSLLIGLVCARPWWVKLDDDCRILDLSRAIVPEGTIGVGSLIESYPHPKSVLAAAHPRLFVNFRSSQREPPIDLKNGALLISSAAARLSPYPVLYSARLLVSLRGEAYDWADRLLALGVAFFERSDFRVQHYREAWNKREWITQILLKADIVLSSAAARDRVRLTRALRHQNLVSALTELRGSLKEFRALHEEGAIYREALALSLRTRSEQPVCEAVWQRLAARADVLRARWISKVPQLEADLFSWIP